MVDSAKDHLKIKSQVGWLLDEIPTPILMSHYHPRNTVDGRNPAPPGVYKTL